jgi:hypothetical protein
MSVHNLDSLIVVYDIPHAISCTIFMLMTATKTECTDQMRNASLVSISCSVISGSQDTPKPAALIIQSHGMRYALCTMESPKERLMASPIVSPWLWCLPCPGQ